VCPGSTVTLSGEAGAPAASSNEFPIGTRLRVTNLDNNRSITVEVTSVSGSCILRGDGYHAVSWFKLPTDNSPELKEYRDAMAKYAPDAPVDFSTLIGFACHH
jgi:hypothetical protein